MAKNKKKPKRISTPVSSKSAAKTKKPNPILKFLKPRSLSTFAFGISGLLAGIATGLNHFPNMDNVPVVPKMMFLAAYLGDPHADIMAGILTGFTGLVIGACLGFSALSKPKDMAISMVISVVLAFLALTFTDNIAIVGLGFLAGHFPAILAAVRGA